MRKSICIFSSHYPPHIGGVEQYTQNIGVALTKLGLKVTIVTGQLSDIDLPRESFDSGLEVVRIPSWRFLNGRLLIPKRSRTTNMLLREIADEGIDYVLINTRFAPLSFVGLKLSKQLGIRPVVLDHGSAYLTLGNPLFDVAVRAYEHLVSAHMRHCKVAFYGISDKSMKWLETFHIEAKGVLTNSIDLWQYRESALSASDCFKEKMGNLSQTFIVAFAGRLIPEKGIKELVSATKILSDYRDIVFLVAGDGPLRRYVENEQADNLIYLGRLNTEDVSALLLDADVMCLPSRSEGFCMTILEAAACGAIPVVTDVGVARKIVRDESCGIILKDVNPRIIADSILTLYNRDEEWRKKASQKLINNVRENYSWAKAAKQVVSACEAAQNNE